MDVTINAKWSPVAVAMRFTRRRLGWTQPRMARHAGVSANAYSSAERDETTLGKTAMLAIAARATGEERKILIDYLAERFRAEPFVRVAAPGVSFAPAGVSSER